MDVRRVQVTGGSSFMITLPKAWADSVGLKKNDPVSVVPQPNGGLLLTVGGAQAQNQNYLSEIDADSVQDADALYRMLIGAYIAGHSEIVVKSGSALRGGMLEAVSRFTQTSIGMEIVEEDVSRIVMKDLMDLTEVLPQKNVNREYLLVKRMVCDVFQAAAENDGSRLEGMADRDTEVDRIHWLIQRQSSIHQLDIGLSSRMGIDLRTVTGSVGVSKSLERMGDHAVLLAGHLGRLISSGDSGGTCRAMENLSGTIPDLIDASVSSWSGSDGITAERCIRRSKEIARDIPGMFSEAVSDQRSSGAAGMISGSLRRLAEYCADIAESAINVAMER